MASRVVTIGHSPDPDDAFMHYAVTHGKVDAEGLAFREEMRDIETLNRWAFDGRLEVTALSIHAWAHVADRYLLLPHGASMGYGYGPMVVSRKDAPPATPAEIPRTTVAIPGELTTAHLALQLAVGDYPHESVPFDEVIPRVVSREFDAGLIIHEGQLTYARAGLRCVLDLGAWWKEETGLPLPLGGNAVRRDLGDLVLPISRSLRRSIEWGLAHREEALAHALQFGRGLDRPLADRFVGMYVNDWTRDYGEKGREAVRLLLAKAHQAGFLPRPPRVEFSP